MRHPPPPPPAWLMVAYKATSLVSLALLLLYLTDGLECNAFVRLTLALQVLLLAAAVVATWGTTGP